MEEELKKALHNAYSVENMPGHGAQGRQLIYIGTIEYGNRLYLLYRDSNGMYWYRNQIRTEGGKVISEYEAIFGIRKSRKKENKKQPEH